VVTAVGSPAVSGSIVNAVEEGRSIFDNIQNFVHYLLATNAGEVLVMFFAAVVGWRRVVAQRFFRAGKLDDLGFAGRLLVLAGLFLFALV
jgi:capsule polysaccharide export protein KpsC/LpsZ